MSESRRGPHLLVTRDGAVTTLTIQREDALGALSRDILDRMIEFFHELAGDTATRVLVLTGTGRGFIAGADIGEYDGVSQKQFDEYQRLGRSVFDAVEALPQYTIAAINGYALGGGFEIALCCDEILAVSRARFGLPEVKLGLLPGGGGSQRLSRAVGARFAKRLMVTGEFVDADELHRRGLLGAVVDGADELASAASGLAAAVAASAPLAVREAKALVRQGLTMDLPEALTLEQDVLSRLFATEDGREGIAAFIAKREPQFSGR